MDEPSEDSLWNEVRYFRIGDRDVPMFLDRTGEPISLGRWSELRQDAAYRTVAEETVGSYEIRTLWMGAVADPIDAPELVFGTGIFHSGHMISEVESATEAEALASHEQVVERLRAEHYADTAARRPTGPEIDDVRERIGRPSD